MYEAYFGFSQRPFAAAPVANRYFPAASVDAARQALARCVERGAGAGLLIGPPGMGKSLLLQVLAAQFADKMAVVQLAGGRLESRRELLQAILFELQLPYRGVEEGEMRLALVDHLTRSDKCPQGMLLVVDEAQSLPTQLLEELRMMTNLARGGETRVRLVLAGSMELEESFASPDLQAFSQRLAARCYLEPFDRAETLDYLRFQVAVAGGQAERVFEAAAMDAVYRATDGIPRLINQLCDHALLLAYQSEQRPLNAKAIGVAWADLQQLPSPRQHEQAVDGEAKASGQTIEFGALDDDEPTGAGQWAAAVGTERVEMDFSADWPAEDAESEDDADSLPAVHAPAKGQRPDKPVRTAPPPARAKGLRIVEDLDKLQVVVDPYQSLDDEDEAETSDSEEATTVGPDADASARNHERPNVWEDVIIPSQPTTRTGASQTADRASPSPAARSSRALAVPAKASSANPAATNVAPTHRTAAAHDVRAPGSTVSLEEEVVADRYAELDARRPKPVESPARPSGVRKLPAHKDASPKEARHDRPSGKPSSRPSNPSEVADENLDLDERVTLTEAMRLRQEAEAAAAMARVLAESAPELPGEQVRLAADEAPPLPSTEDWLTASETMVLDPTQMPPDAHVAGGPDPRNEIVVIDDEPPASPPSATEPAHRVERKDYKSLLAQLRNG